MTTPLSPSPIGALALDALPPYLSNGVLGVRLASLPYLRGTTMVNGFAGIDPNDGVEGFARAPFAFASDVALDGVRASAAPDFIDFTRQTYDFSAGEITTAWTFRVGETTATVEVVCFCSRSVPALAAGRVTVRVDRAADLSLTAGLDPTDVPGFGDSLAQPQDQGPNEGVDGRFLWHSGGDISTLGIAYASKLAGDRDAERQTSRSDERGWFSTTYRHR